MGKDKRTAGGAAASKANAAAAKKANRDEKKEMHKNKKKVRTRSVLCIDVTCWFHH